MSRTIIRATWNILLLSFLVLCKPAYADSKILTVRDPRPVAKAVEHLEALYGLPITYEDPTYVHESELADVTDQVRRDVQTTDERTPRRDGQIGNRVFIPKGGTISFRYDMPSAGSSPGGGQRQSGADRKIAVTDAISNVFHGYAASHGGAMFAVVEDYGLFHVVPTHFINAKGETEQLTPLLDTAVTIVPEQRTGADLVSEICRSLSAATGQTVVVGITPASLLARHVTSVADSNASARSLLSRLLAETDVPMSWQLLYDPGLRWYVLNIHRVNWVNK